MEFAWSLLQAKVGKHCCLEKFWYLQKNRKWYVWLPKTYFIIWTWCAEARQEGTVPKNSFSEVCVASSQPVAVPALSLFVYLLSLFFVQPEILKNEMTLEKLCVGKCALKRNTKYVHTISCSIMNYNVPKTSLNNQLMQKEPLEELVWYILPSPRNKLKHIIFIHCLNLAITRMRRDRRLMISKWIRRRWH